MKNRFRFSLISIISFIILLSGCSGNIVSQADFERAAMAIDLPPTVSNIGFSAISFDLAPDGSTQNVKPFSMNISSSNTFVNDRSAIGTPELDSLTLNLNSGAIQSSFVFTDSNLNTEKSNTLFTYYTLDLPNGDQINLITPTAANLDYRGSLGFGIWQGTGQTTFGSDAVRGVFFYAFGTLPDTSVPTVGQANYSGTAIGVLSRNNQIFDLVGDVALNVDFAAQSVTGDFMNMMTINFDTGAKSPWRDFSVSNGLFPTTTTIAGDLLTTDGLLSGQLAGTFFQDASSLGGLWDLEGDGEIANGVFGTDQDLEP